MTAVKARHFEIWKGKRWVEERVEQDSMKSAESVWPEARATSKSDMSKVCMRKEDGKYKECEDNKEEKVIFLNEDMG